MQDTGPGMNELFHDLAVEQEEAKASAREGDLHMAKVATDEWFAAHDRYHKASARYNDRLLLVRSERERGNWSMKVDEEYADLNAAQSAALAADTELYIALKAAR